MLIGVLGNAESWYLQELQRAGGELGHDVVRLEFPRIVASCGFALHAEMSDSFNHTPQALAFEDARACSVRSNNSRLQTKSGDHDLTIFSAVIIRTMPPGSLEQVVYRMDVLGQLEAAGVTVLNSPKSVECAVDKYLTTAKLEAAGLPVPETIVCEASDDALAAFEQLGRDVVVKPIFGSEGRGIMRVSDPDLALRTFRTLERLQAALYLQRFVNHPGYDIRVLVLDGKILGGMKRVSDGDFRTNVSRDGRGEPHTVTDTEADWALRASAATGARFAGIDIMYDREGRGFVIEVNAVPGWRAFQRVTGLDVAKLVIEACQTRN
ncbi:MAG: RimK family alpha-L-glutamate ligase [Planctomycetia bacterium]|nr:RimK family alpha-L-glutamate ligase [Planctomycetia bacterium]